MSTVITTTVLPDSTSNDTLTFGATGDSLAISGDSLNLNTLQDAGGNTIFVSDGSGTISIAATGAVLPVGSKVGTDAIGTANTVTGVSTRNVPFFTRDGGIVTAATTYVFKGSGSDDIEFENFFFSNGTNIMDTQTFAQFVF